MMQAAHSCPHWETLVKHSEQFKDEKERLRELALSKGLPSDMRVQLNKMVNI